MSFLTDDARAALEQKFQSMHIDEEKAQPVQNEPKVETRADETRFQDKTDVKRVEASSTDDKDEQGHAVPYQRFKEVNESKKQLKAKTAELERQLAEMKAQVENSRKIQTRDQHEPDIFSDIASLYEAPQEDDKVSALEQRIANFEMRAAQVELENEISVITKKFPDVPETVLLSACIQNPDIDLVTVARDYSQFIAEIEERALAKHGKRAPSAPPRPQSTGSSSISNSQTKPRSMADARSAALAYLKQQGL